MSLILNPCYVVAVSTWKPRHPFFWSQNRFYCQQILRPRLTPGVWGLKEEGVERGRNHILASWEGYNWRSESIFSWNNNKTGLGCLVRRAEIGFHTKFQFSSFLSIAFLLRPIRVRRSPECVESLRRIMIGIWSEGLEYHWVLLCFQAARMKEELQTGVLVRIVGSQLGGVWGDFHLRAGGGVIHGSVQCCRNSPGPAEKLRKSAQSVVAWIKYSLLLSCAESQPWWSFLRPRLWRKSEKDAVPAIPV